MTLASALWTFEKEIFQRGDLHVLLAQQSNKDLGTNWSYWGACRGSGALKTLACVAGIWKEGKVSLPFQMPSTQAIKTLGSLFQAFR